MDFDDGEGQPADEFDYKDVDFTKPLLDGPTDHGFDEFFDAYFDRPETDDDTNNDL